MPVKYTDLNFKERVDLAVDAGGVGLWEHDFRSGVYYWNAQLYRLLGYSPNEVAPSSQAWLSRIHYDDIDQVIATLNGARSSQSSFRLEYRVPQPDGSVRWLEERGRFTLCQDADLHHGVVLDISERKNLEAELRESGDRLTIALRGGELGYWAGADNDQYWDETLFRILGYEPHATKPSRANFMRLIHPDDNCKMGEAVMRAGASGEVVSMELRIIRPDGAVRWIESRFRETNRETSYRHGVVRDITDRKNRDEHYLKSQRIEAATQLLGGMVHDFNNLLALITASLERAETLVSEPDAARQLRSTREAAMVGAMFNRRLIGLSHMRTRSPKVLNLRHRIESIMAASRSLIRLEISIGARLPHDLWPIVCDELDFDCALINLLTNARDAITGPGHIDISAENISGTACQKSVRITVSDNGCGMDRATQSRATEAFFSTKGEGVGSGLGLTSVSTFVSGMKGDLCIESTLGEGTAVSFWLPCGIHQSADANEPAGADPTGEGQLILVVDDDSSMREILMQRVEALGYIVEEASGPATAIASLDKDTAIGCVLSDVSMPGEMDGLGLSRWVETNLPHIPVILISGYDHLVRGSEPRDSGRQVLSKTCSRQQLAEALARAFGASPRAGLV